MRRDDRLLLLPITGSESDWYRNVLATHAVHLSAGGTEVDTEGRPITDPDRVRDVVDDFRAKYGADIRSFDPPGQTRVEVTIEPVRVNAVTMF